MIEKLARQMNGETEKDGKRKERKGTCGSAFYLLPEMKLRMCLFVALLGSASGI